MRVIFAYSLKILDLEPMEHFTFPTTTLVATIKTTIMLQSLYNHYTYHQTLNTPLSLASVAPNATTNQPPINHQSTTNQPPINHQSTTNQPPINHQSTTNQPPINHQSTTNQPPINHQSTTNQPPINHHTIIH